MKTRVQIMKRIACVIFIWMGILHNLRAEHIKGGELYYEYLGPGGTANTSQYRVTLKLYIDCDAMNPGQLDNQIPLTIFSKLDNSQVGNAVIAQMVDEKYISYDSNPNPCIENPPKDVCYRIRWFSTTITLPNSTRGYVISYQRCCRVIDIINLVAPSNNFGATYMCEIPGTDQFPDAYINNSPLFKTNDVAAICVNSGFTFSFIADERDGDSLSYALCSGFAGGSRGNASPQNAAPPPYTELPFAPGFSGSSPLGGQASIDINTGLITGIAPGVIGQYVITACAYEYRQGKLINIHRKDIHVAVSDCIPLKALLKPDYSYCDDLNVTFKNEQVNPSGAKYIWNFGDGSQPDTTTDPEGKVIHAYADTGVYNIKLKVLLAGGQCVDSTTTKAKVFPGFNVGFTVTGTCILLPIEFTDTTVARYGNPIKWKWEFGDETTQADTSLTSTASWKYSTTGLKKVKLTVESSKGCIKTVSGDVEVREKPPIGLPFRDTLICDIDTLQLQSRGNGIYSWIPAYNIIDANTAQPLVFPKNTTWYTVQLNENGCVNKDSVRVRVTDRVNLNAGADTTICAGDPIRLTPQTDGLQFRWTPADHLNNATIKNPIASPPVTTTYTLRSMIGKCFIEDQVTITAVPYPSVFAGKDTIICFGDTAQLQAIMDGTQFRWSPVNTLLNSNSLNPRAFPLSTTAYLLSVFDNKGCPKPGVDTVVVTVRPKIKAFAGNDTSIVTGQPLQLNGSGAPLFQWVPSAFLNDPNIQNPTAILNDDYSYVMRTFYPDGCFATDTINIRVFKTSADIFVPNAFVPGGKNKVLRPILVGMATLSYFRIYNRWGQLVFQTSASGHGWDGTLGGQPQASGTYVWIAQGTDYTGKLVLRKGTAILIR